MKKTVRKILLLLFTLVFSLSSLGLVACANNCEHKYNGGELTSPIVNGEGTITYTCTLCSNKKQEKIDSNSKLLTRKEAEDALVSVAWAYFAKGNKLQYDSSPLSKISHWNGGISRLTRYTAPEYGTSDTSIYSVCSTYTYDVYLQALGRRIWEYDCGPNAITTQWLFLAADNQVEDDYKTSTDLDPVTDKDKDTAILRWVSYEEYKKENSTDLEHANRLGTLNSSSFTDWYTGGKLKFQKTADGSSYEYLLDGKVVDPQKVKMLINQYVRPNVGEYANIRPGDVVVSEDHAEIYIGNGFTLDCAGAKYDIQKGTDKVENSGSVSRLHSLESVITNAKNAFIIVRPLDYYMTDCDGNPDNDLMTYDGKPLTITDATYSRMQYEMMDIDRTVDISPFGTAVHGDNLTYTVKITNKSGASHFVACKEITEKGYYGKEYTALPVTETIPDGTEFVSASEGYSLKDGVLSWTLDVPIGETIEVSYTVKVTANVGETIVSGGGSVANIPSNTITNRVGNAKLNAEQNSILDKIKQSDVQGWANKYGTDLDFAQGVYKELGVNLELPSVEDIAQNLFTPKLFDGFPSTRWYLKDSTEKATMFTLNKNVTEEYSAVKNMLVDNYWGGYRFYGADYEKLKNDIENFDFTNDMDTLVKDLSFNNLEVGDVLVFATAKDRGDTTMTNQMSVTRVFLFVGNKTLLEMNSAQGGAIHTGANAQNVLTSTFQDVNDLFFLLRPSQAVTLQSAN